MFLLSQDRVVLRKHVKQTNTLRYPNVAICDKSTKHPTIYNSLHNMSRSSSVSSARNLSLTEELEKLEQSITLTLQGELAIMRSRSVRLMIGQKSITTSVEHIGLSPPVSYPLLNNTQNTPRQFGKAQSSGNSFSKQAPMSLFLVTRSWHMTMTRRTHLYHSLKITITLMPLPSTATRLLQKVTRTMRTARNQC